MKWVGQFGWIYIITATEHHSIVADNSFKLVNGIIYVVRIAERELLHGFYDAFMGNEWGNEGGGGVQNVVRYHL